MGEQVGNSQIFCRIEQCYSSHRIQVRLDGEDSARSDEDGKSKWSELYCYSGFVTGLRVCMLFAMLRRQARAKRN